MDYMALVFSKFQKKHEAGVSSLTNSIVPLLFVQIATKSKAFLSAGGFSNKQHHHLPKSCGQSTDF